jgi:hypothetical protein
MSEDIPWGSLGEYEIDIVSEMALSAYGVLPLSW